MQKNLVIYWSFGHVQHNSNRHLLFRVDSCVRQQLLYRVDLLRIIATLPAANVCLMLAALRRHAI